MAGSDNKYSAQEEERLLGGGTESRVPKLSSSKQRHPLVVALYATLISAAALALVYLVNGYESSSVSVSAGFRNGKPDQPLVASHRSSKRVVHQPHSCNSVGGGYQCFADISHRWGQYSPYFSLAAESISDAVPQQCDVTFVQVLSRHGARYPTASKGASYKELIETIQANATAYKNGTTFLRTYNYTLGTDDLTTFGEREMVNSGVKFYERYEALTRDHTPFVRSSGSSRVVQSGQLFLKGFDASKKKDRAANHNQSSPKINVVISEDSGSNNTLNHNTCPAFEDSTTGDDVSDTYAAIFAPPIQSRLQAALPGVSLSLDDVTYLMDMCAYDTVSTTADASTESAFCALFTDNEWSQYNYYQSLGKYYGYGAGNSLGPTQGVGFVNELIARMTHTPVQDHTSTNHTLDRAGASTFPVDKALYADFTHDNGMIPIFFALGLYNETAPLPTTHVQAADKADGFSAAWTVPFAARAYFEMMDCGGSEPLVRALVNDRVVPLQGCGADKFGRCSRKNFVEALSFAREGGHWDQCYA